MGLRQRRYKRLLFSSADLSRLAPVWAERLASLECVWRTGALSEPEVAALYLLISLEIRCPGTWLVGPSPSHLKFSTEGLKLKPWLAVDDRMKQWLPPDTTVAEVLSRFSLRGVRLAAREVLLRWLNGEMKLKLTDKVPSPQQMLSLQALGSRWVSVIFNEAALSTAVHDERDALSFLLHDLGHAAQFFSQPDYQRGQIGFYRLLQAANKQSLLDAPARHDANWTARLNYLMADLNTHPAHFVSVFWANARETFNATQDLTAAQVIAPGQATIGVANAFAEWRKQLYSAWNLKAELIEAHEKLIDGFCPKAAQKVIGHLNQVGS